MFFYRLKTYQLIIVNDNAETRSKSLSDAIKWKFYLTCAQTQH